MESTMGSDPIVSGSLTLSGFSGIAQSMRFSSAAYLRKLLASS